MLIQTSKLQPAGGLSEFVNSQAYCGLDAMVTLEVWQKLRASSGEPKIYSFSRALQAPYMDIMARGFRVNELGRRQALEELSLRMSRLQRQLDLLARAVWGKGLNPRSPLQLKSFFYSAMRVPEVWIYDKGTKKLSVNREALEIVEQYLHAQVFVSHILRLRDLGKQISVLGSEVDQDRRMRTSYNIAGTETGRPSSSTSAFGTGTNLQNIAPSLRWIFEADSGWKLGVVDLEQTEARDVGYLCGVLFGDWDYLDACESGDLHTNNAKRIWRELPWPGDPQGDRALAEEKFYREYSYRDMSKRGGHMTNYKGTARTGAKRLKIPLKIMEDFQHRYCTGPEAAFPAIPRYWAWVATELQEQGRLVTPFGRERYFFGRLSADETIREAIAFLPQSMTADRMNLGLWRVWHEMPQVQLLAQTYDSITFQYQDLGPEHEAEVLTRVLELIRVELIAPNGRSYVVPGEAKVGWNWGTEGSEGLKKWSKSKPDLRQRRTGLHQLIV